MVFLTEINQTVRFQFVTDYIDNANDGPCLCHIKRLLFLTEWLLCFQLDFYVLLHMITYVFKMIHFDCDINGNRVKNI